MGIRRATVEEAILSIRRKRKHRSEILNDIEADLTVTKEKLCNIVEDTILWRRESKHKYIPTESKHLI